MMSLTADLRETQSRQLQAGQSVNTAARRVPLGVGTGTLIPTQHQTVATVRTIPTHVEI